MATNSIINLLLLGFFILSTLNISFSSNINGSSNSVIGCIESEKQALLQFKQHLLDPANRLASWVADEDCCRRWVGVVCDNVTGHVLELHLGLPTLDYDYDSIAEIEANEKSRLGGKISHSLLNLTHLNYLDLSNNYFGGIPIPNFFGSMVSLRCLNLSGAGFGGLMPHQLGNLSNMEYLHLNDYDERPYVENLRWLAGMSRLQYLNLSYVNLSNAFDWLQTVNMLPSLKELHLSDCQLPPTPTDHLLNPNLPSLAILNLRSNNLQNTSPMIISWVFSLKSLVSLDLRDNALQGPIPDGLQNLTCLRHLDLSYNEFNYSIPDWFYGFSPLESINLAYNNLKGNISSAIGNMTSAISLDLTWNKQLEGGIPKELGNLCNLKSISLSVVKLSQNISDILQMLSLGCISHGLESLDLSFSNLFGQLTDHLGYFKNLRVLDLSQNSIVGSIPESLGELSMLRVLDVSYNKLEGNFPESFGQLANLERVSFQTNMLKGVMYENHFANLTKLKSFYGGGNSFILKVNPNWNPPFQLEILLMRSWNLGPQIPSWLHSQKQLRYLDISNSGITSDSNSIPSWFWNMSSQLYLLNISHNQFYGEIPYIPFVQSSASFDFSSNSFNGTLPRFSSNLRELYISNNSLSGSLSYFLCHPMNETMSLMFLSLSENFLFGELPDCWMKWPKLLVLKLDGNNLTGSIPTSMGMLTFLGSLHLRHNRISGELPHSLQNCSYLVILDLSENELTGQIPTWLGSSFPRLMMLNFRSNNFHGHIPDELCTLDALRILDFSQNNLFGFLPKCIGNFSAMATPDDGYTSYELAAASNYLPPYPEYGSLVMKGQLVDYSTILRLVRSIDLSDNNFSGEIPEGVVKLQYLVSLNLSHNHLSGRIPEGIGGIKSLESLDFSENQLYGSIPQSLTSLTFLSHLNLSNNDLIGKIPSSTQISTFKVSSFIGNRLCGPPLTQNCSAANGRIHSTRNEGRGDEVDWFYVAMAIGFGTGFGVFLVPLMLSRRWSCIYFKFLDRMWTRILLLYAKATRSHAF
ncbi:hypothetical protein COLO4_09602 [Corchorus olitorius]|uniref:Leucine-rich repeat-containing N-terminal plant-type domain-containing protein n=1 Tax=Corchorus olitorius TaxID=93759 RepID=A0A1R3KBR5_9ROSI|nr:hypothetical protein COLO4_09602 [Corchorus olitorius]